eukprot:TRINITY_DN79124_c0_g1_i1.p1 TRINITY_DN79124_c0_g1~~TRINITY_DN79124_c0_g1_i1.p1  ORF type:complete len:204 (+),score=46.46 TRINITY_DN79124_c0_g1_i1:31-612(+)
MGASSSSGSCRPCGRDDDDACQVWPTLSTESRGGSGPSAPIPAKSTSCNSALLRGAREGNPALVREALDAGAATETRSVPSRVAKQNYSDGDLGLTALMHAARGGHLTCVMALLDSRAALDAEDEEGATPLHYAAQSGDLDVFKALILAGADAAAVDTQQRAALDYLPEKVKQDPDLQKSWRAVLRNELPYGV